MAVSRALSLALGTFAISSGLATLSFEIIFSSALNSSTVTSRAHITAIVAATIGSVTVILLVMLWCRQIRYRNGAHIQDFGHGKKHTYLLAGVGGIFCVMSAVVFGVMLAMLRVGGDTLPTTTINSPTEDLVTGGFVIWAVALVSQALFVVCMFVAQKTEHRQHTPPYSVDPEQQAFPEMIESGSKDGMVQENGPGPSRPMTSPPSTARSRAGSDTRSLRSSLSQGVRPVSSKTKLIQGSGRSHHRPPSINSDHRCTSINTEDGFDSWDTSSVDAQARKAVESASPLPQRFLETIPASPTNSRSPSPGFPLDLEPPKTRQRSRSYSPALSPRETSRSTRNISPTESMISEAHIHPLFRTDSSTPPPAATPNTVVVAAIGGGQVLSDRLSIRSLQRMRSGSLPSSPLIHTPSLESIRKAMEREELERLEVGAERTLTPPVPDYILNAGPRNSTHGYNARKKSQTSLNKLGEVRNET